jgi:GTP-binding protein YchF
MSLSVGIVGLPNIGKSTLFNALLGQKKAKVGKYPFTTKDKNVGIVEVPDSNLEKLAEIVGETPRRTQVEIRPASIKFVDIAGLVKGAHKGEGLGNEFLGHIREVDVICQVVRVFTDPNVSHVIGDINSQRDIEVVNTELLLKDLETIEKAKGAPPAKPLATHGKSPAFAKATAGKQKLKVEKTIEKLSVGLNSGKMARDLNLTPEEEEIMRNLFLLTAKRMVYFLNSDEEKIVNLGGAQKEKDFLGCPSIWACAKLEEDLAELTPEEQKEYLSSLGIESSGADLLIQECFGLLDLITFYTIAGGKIIQAWSLQRGETALSASEKVHTDMARGFIMAEVVSFADLIKASSWKKARQEGKVRLEGKEYVIKDEEVVEFRFKV